MPLLEKHEKDSVKNIVELVNMMKTNSETIDKAGKDAKKLAPTILRYKQLKERVDYIEVTQAKDKELGVQII